MRRRLQSLLMAHGASHRSTGITMGAPRIRALGVAALASMIVLSVLSMVTLSSSPAFRANAIGLRFTTTTVLLNVGTNAPTNTPTNTPTAVPTTAVPTTAEPTTAEPTPEPTTAVPTTAVPTPEPTTAAPTPVPTTATPSPAEMRLARRRARVAAVADSLARIASQTTLPRGIVLPLFDGNAYLGISLIMELRAIGVDLPIEIPYCGDLNETLRSKLQQYDVAIRIYDVCQEASSYAFDLGNSKFKLFCRNIKDCYTRFRNFDIKILALLLSKFDEVMMMDADALFFQSPMKTWLSPKYTATGTLFFHDRVSCDTTFLAARRDEKRRPNVTFFEEYLGNFDPVPFRKHAIIPRPLATSTPLPKLPIDNVRLAFQPSEFLVTSHAWNRRAGHQADSSLMLWHKKRQARATAILGSFIAQGGIGRPPSYGDKEFYFIACELAETAYAFSDFGTGAFGADARLTETPGKSVLCGDALHYMPDDTGMTQDQPTLFINSDRIMEWNVTEALYRTKARPASLYAGRIEERGLAQECPFDVDVERITAAEIELLERRQRLHAVAASWGTTAAPILVSPRETSP